MINEKIYIKNMAKVEAARRNFYYFCKLKLPKLYKKDRPYLKVLCDKLEKFYFNEDKYAKLIINMGPRSGKSITLQLYEEWILGLNTKLKIIAASYNELLSASFGKAVRDEIMEVKADYNKIVYSDIFPNTKIKRGSSNQKLWALDGAYKTFLATSPTGTATGFGCDYLIIDDIIKNAEEAYNENILEKHWDWFGKTMISRIEGKVIVVFTRWNRKDLCGRLMEFYKENNIKYEHITMKAEDEKGNPTCEAYLNKEQIEFNKKIQKEIFNANYNQEPIDIKGTLYTKFNIYNYEDLKKECNKQNKTIFSYFDRICGYVDTADEGSDYLCCIIYGIKNNNIYILDVYYTKEAMEITEPYVANMINNWSVSDLKIESNNGGRGWARNVHRLLNDMGNYKCNIIPFTQTKNKISRILGFSSNVMNRIYFPEGWSIKFEEFFKDIVNYQREAKNKHDDAPDALTGCYEMIEQMGY